MPDMIIDNLKITDLTDEQLEKLNIDTLIRYRNVDVRANAAMTNAFNCPEDLGRVGNVKLFSRLYCHDEKIMSKIRSVALQAADPALLDEWIDANLMSEYNILKHFFKICIEKNQYLMLFKYPRRIKLETIVIKCGDPLILSALNTIESNGPSKNKKLLCQWLIREMPNSMLSDVCDLVEKQNSVVPASYMLIWRDDIPEKYHATFAKAYADGGKSVGALLTKINPDIVAAMPSKQRFNFMRKSVMGQYPFTHYVDSQQLSEWLFATMFKHSEEVSEIISTYSFIEKHDPAILTKCSKTYSKYDRYHKWGHFNQENNKGVPYAFLHDVYRDSWRDAQKLPKYEPSVEVNKSI